MKQREMEVQALLRLRRLREDTARRQREAQRVLHAQALERLRECEAGLAALQERRQAIARWCLGEGAVGMARLHGYAGSRQEQLEIDCEHARDKVLAQRRACAEAEQALAQAHARWLRDSARTGAAEKLQRETRVVLARQAELRTEREAEPATARSDR